MSKSSKKRVRRRMTDLSPEERQAYKGEYVLPLRTRKEKKKYYTHPIFLYTVDMDNNDFKKLHQVVNVYEHSPEDFEFNVEKIIKHYKRYIGDTASQLFTIGQTVRFRVRKGQEPYEVSLFKFFINYTLLSIPVLMGGDLSDWKPWSPEKFTPKLWEAQINLLIYKCRALGNMREMCERIQFAKNSLNKMATQVGDRLGMSISNNEFIEVAKRDKEARKSITCSFDIKNDITPSELEELTMTRTHDLLDTISHQHDLSISTYAQNGLFHPGQFREFAVHIGHKPDLAGNTIPYTSKTNILMGIKDPLAYSVDAHGGRKAELIKLKVSKAGDLERQLCLLLQDIKSIDMDKNHWCHSKHLRMKHISSQNDIEMLDGRVATFDEHVTDDTKYFVIDRYKDEFDLIGKTIYLKTPITCTHPLRSEGVICGACYGLILGALNQDVHPGRITALNSANDIEQTLLSAKHSLFTNTAEIKFSDNFDRYFINDTCQIRFNDEMIELSSEEPEEFSHYYLEFHLSEMSKHQDGEARQYDRGINEILVYDDRDESKDSITELNGSQLYLSRELVEYYFLDAMRHATTDIVRIPFSDLIDTGKPTIDIVFEYQFKNSELADAIVKLTNILGNGEAIAMYETYEDCLNGIIPLFRKGGITKLHEVHFELIVSQLICDEDGGLVDWTEEHPSYKFRSMTKAILANQSVTASLIARESSKQIAGAYGTYEKHGVSDYDAFLLDTSKLKDNDVDDEDERVDLNEIDDDELDRVRGILDDLIEEEKR